MGFISHNPLSVSTLLVSPWSSRTNKLWSMYNSLITFLWCQSKAVSFTCSSLHGQIPFASLLSKRTILLLCPKFVLILVSGSALHPQFLFLLSYPRTSSIFLSTHLLSILATVFAACAMRLILWWSLHFAAFCSLFDFTEILGPLSSLIYVADQLCHNFETFFSHHGGIHIN